MRHAYVYYRVDPAQLALAAARINAVLQAMAPHCGCMPRLLRRCDDPSTWMEVYEDIADFEAFAASLATATATSDCAAFIKGERHLECFAPI